MKEDVHASIDMSRATPNLKSNMMTGKVPMIGHTITNNKEGTNHQFTSVQLQFHEPTKNEDRVQIHNAQEIK